jgi:DNA-binding CsgD family transcriptional regulator
LQTAILAAAGLPIGDPGGGWVACCRPSGRRPYLLHVLPTPADDCGTLIVLIDLDRRIEPPVEVLRRIYGLTRAESQVAMRVLNGDGLAPIAEELSVSLTTVRTHLQRIFDKTGTHRQAELVRLLLTVSG